MRRIVLWVAGAVLLVALLGVAADVFLDEPVRRRMERGLDASLEGYGVRVGAVDLSPFGFAVELQDVVVRQDAHPDPPVLRLPRLRASLEWRALLHGGVVGDVRLDDPTVHVNLAQVRKESRDQVPVGERGWQQALQEIYPLEINAFDIRNGTIEYLDEGPLPPVRLTGLVLRAENIRNVRSGEREYPSTLDVRARVLDSASLRARGRADFLADPYPGARVRFALDDVALRRLEPVLRHAGVAVRGGRLAARGTLEYAPARKRVEVAAARLVDADLEYVKQREAQPGVGERTTQAAVAVTQEPEVLVRADEVRITRTTLAYSDRTTDPPYRVFVGDCDATLAGFTNRRAGGDDGPSRLTVDGRFMGSGDLDVAARFRPQPRGADFDLDLTVENTDATALNDLWRAYGGFDVAAGRFSLYSELGVHGGRVEGYVKPIFRDLQVYDGGQDAEKGITRRAYEAIVGGAASILENPPRDQVATETRLSGSLDDPNASTWQALTGIVRNAFFQAILPGLERSRGDG